MSIRNVILALVVAVPLAAAPTEKPKLSFVKDIVPIFTKSGCANSNCHAYVNLHAGEILKQKVGLKALAARGE